MCLPALPLIGVIASVAQAGAGFAGAQQQASMQNAYFTQNRNAAIAAANDRYASLNNNTIQDRQASSQQLMQKRVEALQARSKAMAAAGEAGVTGLSVTALSNDYDAQLGRQEQAIQTNFDIKKMHNYDESIATQDNTIARINSVRQAADPSILPYVIQGIGGSLNAVSKPAFVNGGGSFDE